MHRFAVIFATAAMAATQVQAELIINGKSVTVTPTVVSSSANFQPQNHFQSCLAN